MPTMPWINHLGRRAILFVGSAGLALVGDLQFFQDALPAGSDQLPGASSGIFAAVCVYMPSSARCTPFLLLSL
jgi:hypothetical protein